MDTKTSTLPKIDPGSPYAVFETDKSVEQNGVKVDYGSFYFQVARAGGANTRFRDVFRQRMAPHKRALATETMNDDLADKISLEVFAETVVLGWGSKKHGEGVMTARDGSGLSFTIDNVKQVFADLPELARDIMQQAQSLALFRSAIAGADAKN
jgi:hypothetical protein